MTKKCTTNQWLFTALAGAALVFATAQDIKHKGLFYQALPKSLQAGLDDFGRGK